MLPVTVLGAGSWGTALARYVAREGAPVRLWGHDPDKVHTMARLRENTVYLPGFPLSESIQLHDDPAEALAGAGSAIVAVPSHHVREVLGRCRNGLPEAIPLILVTKGIEAGTLMLMTEIAGEVLGAGSERLAVLSGPSFAVEVARGDPTAIVVASRSDRLARAVQSGLSSHTLRLYTSEDVTGVQVAGALKNVMAIAAGILSGMGLGANSLAALLTRGLAEIGRLGAALGGRPETFAGLAGAGDLILTGTNDLSRNRRVGIELGKGRRPAEILGSMTMVAEGVRTAKPACALAGRAGVEMPIVEQVRRVLYDGVSPPEAIAELMRRRLRSEGDR